MRSQDCRDILLESLHFPEIYQRQQQVELAHETTFAWIFDGTKRNWGNQDSFVDWLQSDSALYWIAGKPGSGKSTLMRMITEDHRTLDLLHQSQQREPVLIKHFFWCAIEAGSAVPKSICGMLRSLLYQLYTITESCIPAELLRGLAHRETWTRDRLIRYLSTALEQAALVKSLLIVVDGLDECEDEENDLLKIIDLIRTTKNIKIVASSRDMQDYLDYFEDGPRLTTHEKTRDDIENFAKSQINVQSRFKAVRNLCNRLSHVEQQTLVKTITDKSEGVFLWVKFAIKEIQKGANSDSLEELLLRLGKLPVDLRNMFEYMIGRIPQDYQHRAMLYFRLLAMEGPGRKVYLRDLAFVRADMKCEASQPPMISSGQQLFEEYLIMKRSVSSHTAGLLRVTTPVVPRNKRYGFRTRFLSTEERNRHVLQLISLSDIDYIHRSAFEVVQSRIDTEKSLASTLLSDIDLKVRLVRSKIHDLFLQHSIGDEQASFEALGSCLLIIESAYEEERLRLLQIVNGILYRATYSDAVVASKSTTLGWPLRVLGPILAAGTQSWRPAAGTLCYLYSDIKTYLPTWTLARPLQYSHDQDLQAPDLISLCAYMGLHACVETLMGEEQDLVPSRTLAFLMTGLNLYISSDILNTFLNSMIVVARSCIELGADPNAPVRLISELMAQQRIEICNDDACTQTERGYDHSCTSFKLLLYAFASLTVQDHINGSLRAQDTMQACCSPRDAVPISKEVLESLYDLVIKAIENEADIEHTLFDFYVYDDSTWTGKSEEFYVGYIKLMLNSPALMLWLSDFTGTAKPLHNYFRDLGYHPHACAVSIGISTGKDEYMHTVPHEYIVPQEHIKDVLCSELYRDEPGHSKSTNHTDSSASDCIDSYIKHALDAWQSGSPSFKALDGFDYASEEDNDARFLHWTQIDIRRSLGVKPRSDFKLSNILPEAQDGLEVHLGNPDEWA